MKEYKQFSGYSEQYLNELASEGWVIINTWYNQNGVLHGIMERQREQNSSSPKACIKCGQVSGQGGNCTEGPYHVYKT